MKRKSIRLLAGVTFKSSTASIIALEASANVARAQYARRRSQHFAAEAMERRMLLSGYTLTTLVSFSGQDGQDVDAGLIADAAGNLFGTTQFGGPQGVVGEGGGNVFEVLAGTQAPLQLASFSPTSGYDPKGGLYADATRDLYGTNSSGGAYVYFGTVFEVAFGSNIPSALVSFDGTNGQDPQAGLIADAAGNLYGTTYEGGANEYGTVFEVAAGTHALSSLVSFNGINGANPQASLIADAAGNLYGTTTYGGVGYIGDEFFSGDGTVFEVAAGTHALSTLVSFNGANGANPYDGDGLITDAAGNLYGTTYADGAYGDGTVFEVAAGTHTLSTLASFDGTNGANPEGSLFADAAGNLFGTTYAGGANGYGTVFEVAAVTHALSTIVTFNSTNGQNPVAGLVAAAGNLYGTTEFGGTNGDGTVFELSPNIAAATQLAFIQQPTNTLAGITISPPITVAVEDSNGNIVTTDNSNVTLSILNGPAGATLGGTLSVSAVNGVATFSNITPNSLGNYTVAASDGSLAGVNSTTFFTIAASQAGAASQLAFIQQPAGALVGSTISPAIIVAVEDSNGNAVTTDNSTVTLYPYLQPADGSLGGTLSVTAVNGIATFSNIVVSTPGNYTLLAEDVPLTATVPLTAISQSFTAVPDNSVDTANTNEITGWAVDPENPSASINIEVNITGGPSQIISANESRSDLENYVGSTNHGFTYSTPVLSAGSHTAYIYAIEKSGVGVLLATETLVSQNSFFDEHYYLQMNPDVAAAIAAGKIATGYDHYILYGQYEGRSPSPYWDEAYYLQVNPDVAAAVKARRISSGFMHYYLYGQYENRPGLLYFNTNYYLQNNPDVAAAVKAGVIPSAFDHFVLYGQYEGRSPMLYFSSAVYDADNQDVLPYVTGETLSSDFEQFVEYGQYEGRVASNYYNEQIYLADNPDVAAVVMDGEFPDGFQHWLEYGQYEGRTAV